MNTKVSIITPVYNCEQYIADAIESVLAQTYTDWELLLADDGSTDSSTEIITRYASKDHRIRHIQLSENGGAAKARNAALKEASGRYIAYLDADDRWLSHKLNMQISFMEERNIAFSCCDYECINTDGSSMGRVIHMPESYTYEQLLKNTVIQTVGVIIDLQKVDKQLLVMPDIRRGQDSTTWLQILKAGIVFHGQNEVLAQYRKVSGSLSSNRVSAARRTWYLLHNVEQLPLFKALWCMAHWTFHASRRRVFIRTPFPWRSKRTPPET